MARSDLVRSAYRYLIDSGVPAQLITTPYELLGFDSVYPTGWIFRSEVDGLPFVDIENTGKCAITLYSYDDWSAPSRNHSSSFPRLNVSIFADSTRDAAGNPLKRDAKEKVERIHELIHPLFHDSGNRLKDRRKMEVWGWQDGTESKLGKFDDLIIVSSLAGGGLSIGPTPNGDGMMRGTQGYDITLM